MERPTDGGAAVDAPSEATSPPPEPPPGPVPDEPPLAPCMSAEAAVAWARGRGAEVVADTLARHLTDLLPADRPALDPAQAAAGLLDLQAVPLRDPACASLLARVRLDLPGARPDAVALLVFGPALTEPQVVHGECLDGLHACAVAGSTDLDGDGRLELFVDAAPLDGPQPARRRLLAFPDDHAPVPLWISDDDPIRRVVFGEEGDADDANQLEVVRVDVEPGAPARLRVDYRLLFCEDGACEPTGAETMEFRRLGDVFLLPNETEPGAPWGRPESLPWDGGAPETSPGE